LSAELISGQLGTECECGAVQRRGEPLRTIDRWRIDSLDVFVDEPNVLAEVFDLDNAVLFPHIGSATAPGPRQAMAPLAIRNFDRYLNTGELVTPILHPHR